MKKLLLFASILASTLLFAQCEKSKYCEGKWEPKAQQHKPCTLSDFSKGSCDAEGNCCGDFLGEEKSAQATAGAKQAAQVLEVDTERLKLIAQRAEQLFNTYKQSPVIDNRTDTKELATLWENLDKIESSALSDQVEKARCVLAYLLRKREISLITPEPVAIDRLKVLLNTQTCKKVLTKNNN